MEFDVKRLFGAEVKRRRTDLGMSQEQLAERADLHRTYVSDVEGGKRNPSLASIERLAKALGTSLATVFSSVERSLQPNGAEGSAAKALEILLGGRQSPGRGIDARRVCPLAPGESIDRAEGWSPGARFSIPPGPLCRPAVSQPKHGGASGFAVAENRRPRGIAPHAGRRAHPRDTRGHPDSLATRRAHAGSIAIRR
jgi:Predicted transcriptional regulator with C-terminal CBS domains